MIDQLLQLLQQEQNKGKKKGYLPGLFPSQRFHSFIKYAREDENVFFSAAITYTLQQFSDRFTPEQLTISNQITEKVMANYPLFKNFEGRATYNFFKTKPMDFFPNGKFMKHFKFFKLADDADDTAYVYLTADFKKEEHDQFNQLLQDFANSNHKRNKHSFEKYQKLNCYGVYFGKNMPTELDACVLSNILIWKSKNNIPFNKTDLASIHYLKEMILSNDYLHNPHIVSPCYPTTAQICYHMSRLISVIDIDDLISLKPVLINHIKTILKKPKSFIEQLLLHISLLYLDKKAPVLNYDIESVLKESYFFYTAIPLMIPQLWVRKLMKYKWIHFLGLHTKCNGYVLALLLEHELLIDN